MRLHKCIAAHFPESLDSKTRQGGGAGLREKALKPRAHYAAPTQSAAAGGAPCRDPPQEYSAGSQFRPCSRALGTAAL